MPENGCLRKNADHQTINNRVTGDRHIVNSDKSLLCIEQQSVLH